MLNLKKKWVYLFLCYVFKCFASMHVRHCRCCWCLQRPEKSTRFLKLALWMIIQSVPCECWDPNLSPLLEWIVLFTTEPSPQPLNL